MRALALLMLTACGAVKFDVDQDLAEQTVPGSVLGGVLPSFIPNPMKLNIDVKSEVAKRGTGPARAAYLTQLTLSVTPHGSTATNFDFIDEVHLYVEALGVTKTEVAKLQPVPRSKSTLDFDIVPEVDLLPFINAGAQITAAASGAQPSKDTTFDGHVRIEVRI
ncbi:MAG: hypothetical protein IPJ65_02495 [Archangiaceae bacterium]|nr:hypothetical protein [Archangiaceae bacterium]